MSSRATFLTARARVCCAWGVFKSAVPQKEWHAHTHTPSGGVATPSLIKQTHAPVVEVHDGLDGAAASGVDVAFEARQQRRHHVHSVPLTLPEMRGDMSESEAADVWRSAGSDLETNCVVGGSAAAPHVEHRGGEHWINPN